MYVIAEIGSNYNNIEDCKISIQKAKDCGANAVKFQHFTQVEMHGLGKRVVTPESWIPILADYAKNVGIHFSVTFFDPHKLTKYIHLLDFVKIAGSNMMDVRLLDIAKAHGKETLISTGGHEFSEVNRVYEYFPTAKFLYCESAYPSFVNNYEKMREFFFHGISDHSKDIYPAYPLCQYAEKHVNLCGVEGTADADHALNVWQFKRYCSHVKGHQKVSNLLSFEEMDMRLYHNVRLVAKTAIKEGEQFTWDNVSVLRGIEPKANYINPMDADLCIGSYAARDLLRWGTIESRDIQSTQPKTEQVHTQR